MKKIIALLLCACIYTTITAQTVSPQVVASAGGHATGTGLAVSYTVGEPVITTVSGGNNILTQGFQQPGDVVSGLLDLEIEGGGSLSVYPLPASAQLWFGYRFEQAGRVEVKVYTLTGQLLANLPVEKYEQGKAIHQLDCSAFAPGSYLLTAVLTGTGDIKQSISKQFQIIH